MKKKLTAFLLAGVLCLTLMPGGSVFAQPETLSETDDVEESAAPEKETEIIDEEISAVPDVENSSILPESTEIDLEEVQANTEVADNSSRLELNNAPAPQQSNIYYVNNLEEFRNAITSIENDNQFNSYEIHLNNDISYGDATDNPRINKDVTILGHGHTLNLGTRLNFAMLTVGGGGKLSLGRENPTGNENELTVTVTPTQYRNTQQALILIGPNDNTGTGILNMYDGVVLTGNTANGSSNGSAVNIQNGTFNMYGGEISNNTNYATPGTGGAVTGRNDGGRTVIFNMYGGSIHDNVTDCNISSYSGAVLIIGGSFSMYGGDISNNNATRNTSTIYNYGGGVTLYNSTGIFEAGRISGNTGSVYGGGIYACSGSNVEIKRGFVITGNTASYGGGLNFNSAGTATIEAGAVIANNTSNNGGDDISFYGNVGGTLNLGDASQMNETVTGTGRTITGWYQDALGNRWTPETAQVVDVTTPLSTERYHLKAAYEKAETFTPSYEFVSGTAGKQLPEEVMNLLPADTTEYEEGTEIRAIAPIETTVKVTDGQWVFKGYDADSKISAQGVIFTGTWEFNETAPATDGNNTQTGGNTGNNQSSGANKPSADKETSVSSPRTGDSTNILLYIVLLSMSGIAGVSAYVYRRKKVN